MLSPYRGFYTIGPQTPNSMFMKASTACLATITLMSGTPQPMFFHRVCLLTKWAFYIKLSHQDYSDKGAQFIGCSTD
jgi:hypothetical protein